MTGQPQSDGGEFTSFQVELFIDSMLSELNPAGPKFAISTKSAVDLARAILDLAKGPAIDPDEMLGVLDSDPERINP